MLGFEGSMQFSDIEQMPIPELLNYSNCLGRILQENKARLERS